ncbi:MAG: tetratricopeptide repeat protein, partial [Gemmatimonadota bacterium]
RVARRMPADVTEARALTPERLSRRLHGDLDAIVLKALEVEPELRYGSALAMAEDVLHHLDGRPIAARSAGRTYRLRKFLTRHRWVAPMAAAFCIVLAAYVSTLVRHGRQLEIERNAALREAERAEQVRDVLVGVFRSADPWTAGNPEHPTEATIPEALATGAEHVRTDLANQPQLQADLLPAIADVYVGLGLPGRARPLLEEALQIQRGLYGADALPVAATTRRLGRVLGSEGRYDSAANLLAASLDVTRERSGPADTTVLGTMIDLGWVERSRGRFAEAERLLVEVTRAAEAPAGVPGDLLARAHVDLAYLYVRMNRLDDARFAARRAIDLARAKHGADHPRTALATIALNEVALFATHEDFDAALADYPSAIRTLERTLGPDHPHTLHAQVSYAATLRSAGRHDASEAVLRDVLARQIAARGEHSLHAANALQNLAHSLYQSGELDEAEELTIRMEKIYEGLHPEGRASPLTTRCAIQLHRGEFAVAEGTCREAVRIRRASRPRGEIRLSLMECRWAQALAGLGQPHKAEPLFDRVVPQFVQEPTQLPPGDVRLCLEAAAATYDARGRADEARSLRQQADGISRRGIPGFTR